jgi:ubiquinone/menaquinone biosynthesis C-methylase UbiE
LWIGHQYNELLLKHKVTPIVRTQAVKAESILRHFTAGMFDFVYSRNALDHSQNPVKAIVNMVRVAKPGKISSEQNLFPEPIGKIEKREKKQGAGCI